MPRAEITGTPEVGQILGVIPTITGALSYQWQRAGKNVDGEVSSTYLVRPEDLGEKIKVRIENGVGDDEQARQVTIVAP